MTVAIILYRQMHRNTLEYSSEQPTLPKHRAKGVKKTVVQIETVSHIALCWDASPLERTPAPDDVQSDANDHIADESRYPHARGERLKKHEELGHSQSLGDLHQNLRPR